PSTYLSIKGTSWKPILRIPIERTEREVEDILFVHKKSIVALINGGENLREPFFIRRRGSTYNLIEKPSGFESIPGGNCIRMDEYFVGTHRKVSEDTGNLEYFLYVFSQN